MRTASLGPKEEVYSLEVISKVRTICGAASKGNPRRPKGDTCGWDQRRRKQGLKAAIPEALACGSLLQEKEQKSPVKRSTGQEASFSRQGGGGVGVDLSGGVASGPASPQLWLLPVSLSPCSSPSNWGLGRSSSCGAIYVPPIAPRAF